MDKTTIAGRKRDTVWKKESQSFYKGRGNQASTLKKENYLELHRRYCQTHFEPVNLHRVDIQTLCAGMNIQNLLKVYDLVPLSKLDIAIEKNKIGASFNGRFMSVANLTDLYRWSNIVKMANYRLSDKEKDILIGLGKKFPTCKDLRTAYEWTISLLNTDICPDISIIKDVLETCSNPEGLFFRIVKGKNAVMSDSIYNGLVLSQINTGKIPQMYERPSLKWLQERSYSDGFRSSPRHHPNIWSQYDYLCCLKLMGYSLSQQLKDSIITYLLSCQSPTGGFYSSIHGKGKTLLKSSAALHSLKLLGKNLNGQFHVLAGYTSK